LTIRFQIISILLFIPILACVSDSLPSAGFSNTGSYGSSSSSNDIQSTPGAFIDNQVDLDPNVPIDFSDAERQPDGSLCVTKTELVDRVEKDNIKECWHENVTQCHDTFITEFIPQQEELCEENFWKSCKITFKEEAYNYTLEENSH
jgi:hypothetical protein